MRTPDAEKIPDLPMTPMIDVVFQLLIFFMLSMHFKEVEGKLILAVPKPGPHDTYYPLDLDEVRITLCADGNVEEHLSNKGAHEKRIKDGAHGRLLVEKLAIGTLEQGAQKPLYRAAARKAREVGASMAKPRYIIDADSEVPYEHVLGIVNAFKELDLHEIEFAANPRFLKSIR